jgi:hypothetical protein
MWEKRKKKKNCLLSYTVSPPACAQRGYTCEIMYSARVLSWNCMHLSWEKELPNFYSQNKYTVQCHVVNFYCLTNHKYSAEIFSAGQTNCNKTIFKKDCQFM